MASRRRTIAVDVKSLRSGNGPNKINKNATAKKPIQPTSESNGIVQSRCTQAAEKTSTSKINPVNGECVSSPQKHVLSKPSTSKVKMGTSPRCSMGPSSSGTSKIVPSRYMQAVERSSLSKSNSHNNDSGSLQPKFSQPKPSRAKSTPPQCSMGPLASGTSKASHQDESLLLRKTVLQSTFSDGQVLPPDFDFSVIGDKTVPQSANETVRNHEDDKNCIEMQAWSLAFITAKMAHNMAKLKPEAEARLLHMMEEEEELHSKVIAKKRQYHLLEKQRQANELLDLQISALTPALETVQPFTESYKTLASAVDTTRHVLPVKNFHIAGDSREFLDKAEACLRESEVLLRECTDGNHEENRVILECLKAIKRDCKEMRQHLPGLLSELSELSSLQSRHSVLVQQAEEEEKLGPEKLMELCCPKQ